MESRSKKAFLTDADDTLWPTFQHTHELLGDFAVYHGLTLPDRDLLIRYWGMTIQQVCNGVFPEFLDKDPYLLWKDYSRDRFDVLPFPGIARSLLRMAESNVLGIVSSGSRKRITSIVQSKMPEVFGHFSFIQGANDHTYHKPDPRVFDPAIEYLSTMGITENNVTYVGDNIRDYVAARDRGLVFFAVTTGITSGEEFMDNGLDSSNIFDSFEAMADSKY